MFAGKTVLYIEDEIDLAELIMDELRDNGLKCIHSPSFSGAMTKANYQKYDAIITDIMIEEGTGDDLIRHIRSTPQHVNHATPIIVTSAYLSPELRADLNGKVQNILSKPHSMDDLFNVLKDYLS